MRHLWYGSLGAVQVPGWEPGGAGHGGVSEVGRQNTKFYFQSKQNISSTGTMSLASGHHLHEATAVSSLCNR